MSRALLHQSNRLPKWHERAVYLGFGMLLLSGSAWLVLHHFVMVAGSFGPEHSPAESWLLRLHGVAAYGFLIVAGALIPNHIRLAWRARRARRTGTTTAVCITILAASGVGLYYIAGEHSRSLTSIVHWAIGLAGTLALIVHATRAPGQSID